MSRASFEFVDVLPSEHPDSDGGSSCRVRGNHLPFGHVLHHEFPSSFFFDSYALGESDVTHKDMEFFVVVPDGGFVGGLVVVFLQQAVGCLSVHGVFVNVDGRHVPCFLLDYAEDIPVEAGGIYPNYVRMLRLVVPPLEACRLRSYALATLQYLSRLSTRGFLGDVRGFIVRNVLPVQGQLLYHIRFVICVYFQWEVSVCISPLIATTEVSRTSAHLDNTLCLQGSVSR